jgi:hypothetical protein
MLLKAKALSTAYGPIDMILAQRRQCSRRHITEHAFSQREEVRSEKVIRRAQLGRIVAVDIASHQRSVCLCLSAPLPAIPLSTGFESAFVLLIGPLKGKLIAPLCVFGVRERNDEGR